MSKETILTLGPNGGAKVYTSLRATSRALSGIGSDKLRRTITRRCESGGGFVGDVWVEYTNYPAGIRRK